MGVKYPGSGIGSPSRSTSELGGVFVAVDAPLLSHALRLGEPRAEIGITKWLPNT